MENSKTLVDEEKLVRCPVCEAVNIDDAESIICYRCESAIYPGKKPDTTTAWAFLLTAMIFYIPANLYPVLLANTYAHKTTSTIMGGVLLLWQEGSYPVALVILIASVIVPILKFIVLIYLLTNARKITKKRKINQHTLHYLVEIVGPWSMVDVFVVTILTGLVHLSTVTIVAGSGATAFVLMVIFTMFSAVSMDSRLFKIRETR